MEAASMKRIGRVRARALAVAMCWSLLAVGGGTPAGAASPGVATFSAGDYHTCAVRTDGTVWCWGYGGYGNLGDGSTGDAEGLRTTPVRVRRGSSTLRGVTKVAVGAGSTCAVRTDGTVWCWGDASQGQLGNGVSGGSEYRTKAVQVRRGSGFLTGVAHIATSGSHVCALRTNGSVYCWGHADRGQVGDGTTGAGMGHVRATAVRVRRGSGYLDRVVAIAAGHQHTCAVRKDGSVWCWGDGSNGQLGDGEAGAGHQRTKPVRVRRGSGYLTRASGIAADGSHTCVRRTDGTAWCWGAGGHGQLGDGTTGSSTTHVRTKPVQVRRGGGVMTRVTGIGAGVGHSCARRSDGSAWCWGSDFRGQLGDGTTGDPTDHARLKPARVIRSTSSFGGVRKLDGGVYHTCALRTDRSLWCWGGNEVGQHGRGTHDEEPHPYPRKVTFP
jgi:alpha-tubulin suppressor-like RCC1 family protein